MMSLCSILQNSQIHTPVLLLERQWYLIWILALLSLKIYLEQLPHVFCTHTDHLQNTALHQHVSQEENVFCFSLESNNTQVHIFYADDRFVLATPHVTRCYKDAR